MINHESIIGHVRDHIGPKVTDVIRDAGCPPEEFFLAGGFYRRLHEGALGGDIDLWAMGNNARAALISHWEKIGAKKTRNSIEVCTEILPVRLVTAPTLFGDPEAILKRFDFEHTLVATSLVGELLSSPEQLEKAHAAILAREIRLTTTRRHIGDKKSLTRAANLREEGWCMTPETAYQMFNPLSGKWVEYEYGLEEEE